MSKKFLTGIDVSGQKIANLADGTVATDAATFGQLEALRRGAVWHKEAKAATTANITLSAPQTIDGVSVVAGDRVLVKDQTTASANGIYVVAAGAWTRATDLDEAAEFDSGVGVSVEQGSANGDKAFIMSTDGTITVGTSAINFVLLGGAGSAYTAGNGLQLVGQAFSVLVKPGGGIVVDGTGVSIDPAFASLAKRYAADVPTNATAVITHSLGTKDLVVSIVEVSTGTVVEADVVMTSVNVVTLTFATAPTTGQYRVIIVG